MPQAIQYPSWYKGGHADAEQALRDLLTPFTEQLNPAPAITLWLPEDYADHLPIVTVFRHKGPESEDGRIDIPRLLVGCLSHTRDDSTELQEFCRQMIGSFRKGGRIRNSKGGYTAIQSAKEVEGPELTAESLVDPRLVYAVYEIETKKPLGRPSTYADIAKQLHA